MFHSKWEDVNRSNICFHIILSMINFFQVIPDQATQECFIDLYVFILTALPCNGKPHKTLPSYVFSL